MPNKTVFISDIHLGDGRSCSPHAPYKPYCWPSKENLKNLSDFLMDAIRDETIAKVVILGDLFDEWVLPSDFSPSETTFGGIVDNKDNRDVISNLKSLAADQKLVYVPGNHDMAITKEFMDSTFEGIAYVGSEKPAHGTYVDGRLVAEHGNRYCLFNAPDTHNVKNNYLPLGYFITRVVTHEQAVTGKKTDNKDVFVRFLKSLFEEKSLIEDLFVSIAGDAGLKPNSLVHTEGLTGFGDTISIQEIGDVYRHLLLHWDKRTHTHVKGIEAIMCDAGRLDKAARTEYFRHHRVNADIVVFGHTHKYDLKRYHRLGEEVHEFRHSPHIGCSHVYANSGAWCVSKCTYVETEIMDERQYVRIFAYPDNEFPIEEAYVKLK